MALLLLTLKNFSELRQEWRRELDSKRKTNRALELLRLVFNLAFLIQLKDKFMKLFEEVIQSKYPSVLASRMEGSINNCFYDVFTERNGSTTVALRFLQVNQDDMTSCPPIADNELFKLLQECEEIILRVMKAYKKPKEKEPGTHILSSRHMRMIQKSFEKSISHAESTSAHFQEITQPFKGVLPSLSHQKEKDEEGYVRRQPISHTEETAGTEELSTFRTFTQYQKHESFFNEMKPKLLDESCERWENDQPSDYVLTYPDVYSNETKYRFFDDKQKALWWAYENVHDTGKTGVFIKVWNLNSENSSSLHTDDLMKLTIQLIHPLEPEIVITKSGMYDTGADNASFPFDPQSGEILQKFIHSTTKINDKIYPIVYGQLSVNGIKLKKIYKVDLDPDETWCAIGIQQMVDLDKLHVKNILGEIESVLNSKKE